MRIDVNETVIGDLKIPLSSLHLLLGLGETTIAELNKNSLRSCDLGVVRTFDKHMVCFLFLRQLPIGIVSLFILSPILTYEMLQVLFHCFPFKIH